MHRNASQLTANAPKCPFHRTPMPNNGDTRWCLDNQNHGSPVDENGVQFMDDNTKNLTKANYQQHAEARNTQISHPSACALSA
jgi:hypothetical protein